MTSREKQNVPVTMPALWRFGLLLGIMLSAGSCGGGADDLRHDLQHGDLAARKRAVHKILRSAPATDAYLGDVVAALGDPELRFTVMSELGLVVDDAVPLLVAALQDPGLKRYARQTLEMLGQAATPGLLRAVERLPVAVHGPAVALLIAHDRDAVPGLIGLLASKNEMARESAAGALRAIGAIGLPDLIKHCATESMDVRRLAIRAVSGLAETIAPSAPGLLAMLGDPVHAKAAVFSLALIGARTVPDLVGALALPELQAAAGETLELIGEPARQPLHELEKTARGDGRAVLADMAARIRKRLR